MTIYDYIDFINDLRLEDYSITSLLLTHLSHLVKTYRVEKGNSGNILEIVVPENTIRERHIIGICGIIQSGIYISDLVKAPHLYKTPHDISILCYDESNNELSPETLIGVRKESNTEVGSYKYILYDDISLKLGSRFKRKPERYFFSRGYFLLGGEHFVFKVINSNINIKRVELFMRCDLFEKVGV